ncbi:hypothetical protein [Streptomyces yanii]|uniref:Uncharacterized protein n=1 Tax=Streptomyces yanii TaxID=78510 RepID=A0ABV5R4V6_9ACTN
MLRPQDRRSGPSAPVHAVGRLLCPAEEVGAAAAAWTGPRRPEDRLDRTALTSPDICAR